MGVSVPAASEPVAVPVEPERPAAAWPFWQRVLFRFVFVYLLLTISPWDWFTAIPGVPLVLKYPQQAADWAVRRGNDLAFHVRPTLIPVNGSGDTSYAYAQLWLLLSV